MKLPFQKPVSAFRFSFILAFFLSTLIVYILGPALNVSKGFGGPSHDGYIEIARNLVQGNGYVFEPEGQPVLHRPPAYPFALTGIALLPERIQRLGVIILNSILLAGTAFLIFKFTYHFFNLFVANFAVLVFVFNPFILWSVKNPMSGIFQMFFYSLFIALILHYLFRHEVLTLKKRFVGGAALGTGGAILALSHGAMLPIVVGVFVFFIAIGFFRKRKDWLQLNLLAICLSVLLIAPWTLRNLLVAGQFIPVAGNMGLAYFNGNAHWGITDSSLKWKAEEVFFARTLRYAGIDRPYEEIIRYWGIMDPEIDGQLKRLAIRHITEHPGDFIKKTFLNAIEYYFPIVYCLFPPDFLPMNNHSLSTRILKDCRKEKLFTSLYYFILWSIAVIAISKAIFIRKKKLHVIFPLGVIIFFALPYFPFLVFIGHNMYTFGTIPFLALLVALGIESIAKSNYSKPVL